ncbi:sensor histidine kinase [Denitratisoma oestradiolicum]|uniref:histidine kinase n=1 Tax=Denitratisoma oestradiolicum TaxID=311182 RepID=A0A6S6Y1I9_9PROT|nr:ATP-binding protein [Denitratisoma oestradiolicum]CAB1370405.1 conserved membrane protein of unknown function [Denitratisoma oestradiolicum]
MSSPPIPGGSAPPNPESYWRSLQYFNLFRLVMATVFVAATHLSGRPQTLGSVAPTMAFWVSSFYLAGAVLLMLLPRLTRRSRFNRQLSAAVGIDILAITLLSHASSEAYGSLSYLLLVVLAAAGLVGQGRLVLFYAALASLVVLLEQGYRTLGGGADVEDLSRAAGLCIGFFGTAISAHLLARRALINEALAEQRRIELDGQSRLNRRIIRDMQDGVLVVDAQGTVRHHNPRAEILCNVYRVPEAPTLKDFSTELSRRYPQWREAGREVADILDLPGGHSLRVRYLPPGESDLALLYLEDLILVQAQARQLKLAALGRLTANMAHEIRNPLAAISHAAELMAEDSGNEAGIRLTRIIGENTQRLNRIVTEVLELGRRDRANIEPIVLADFVAAFLDEFTIIEPRAANFVESRIEPGLILYFDRGHLNRVLLNLVGNAMRYCQERPGSILIDTPRPARLDGMVELHVRDDGPGIDGEGRFHVFEPFFTTRSGGTGLGLYIARELCDANGGSLELMEGEGGAHFRIIGRRGNGNES